MSAESERIEELEREVERLQLDAARLMQQADRYRTAAEDSLQQLDWCIGYFTGSNKAKVAKSLAANRAYIRRNLMKRDDAGMPADAV